jgi:Flp pilus assembly pilin Flp
MIFENNTNRGICMKKIKKFFARLRKDESGQGTAEYVLLLFIVVALVMLFKDRIKTAVTGKIEQVSGSITDFSAD